MLGLLPGARVGALHAMGGSERCFWVRGCSGVPTTIDYHQLILDTADFRAGEVDTGFIPDHESELQKPPPNPKVARAPPPFPGSPPCARRVWSAVHTSPPCHAWHIAHTARVHGMVRWSGGADLRWRRGRAL